MRIEIYGTIASGKTTLGRQIVREIGREDVLFVGEKQEENPFLEKYYNDHQEYYFEKNMTFMMLQFSDVKANQKGNFLICDFSFLQDLAYIDILDATEEARNIFDNTYKYIQNTVGNPDVIIHIKCPIELALDRIKSRNRKSEQCVSSKYLAKLDESLKIRLQKQRRFSKIVEIDDDNQMPHKLSLSLKEIGSVLNRM